MTWRILIALSDHSSRCVIDVGDPRVFRPKAVLTRAVFLPGHDQQLNSTAQRLAPH